MSEELEDIYSATYILFFLNRLFGTAPFILTDSPYRRYQKKFYCVAIGIFNLCAFSFFIWDRTISLYENGSTEHFKMLNYIILGIVSAIFIISSIFRTHSLLEGFRLLTNIDDTIKNLGLCLNYRQLRKRLRIQLFAFLVLFVVSGIFQHNITIAQDGWFDIPLLISYLPVLLVVLVEIQYYTYVHIAFVRFKIINTYLETFNMAQHTCSDASKKNKTRILKNKKISDVPKSVTLLNPLYILETISDLHIQLTDMCTLFNKAFSIQLLSRVGASFVSVLFCLFYAVIYIRYSYENLKDISIMVIVLLIATIYYLMELYLLASVSDKASQEAKNCPIILHKIKHSCTDPDILNAIELYSIQMYHNKLKFTVCGLFPIDHTLLYTMTGALTTYLIFLVQFSSSSYFSNGITNNSSYLKNK